MVKCKDCRALTEDYIGRSGKKCYFGEITSDKDRVCEFFCPKDPLNDAYLTERGLWISGIIS